MSEKQNFNKDIQNRQMAEKRRERWISRKILTEILENIRLQRDNANWVLYQVFQKEMLSYKSKLKIWNHLMRAGYDLAKEKPEKNSKYKQLKEADELLEKLYTHLIEKGACTAWNTKEDCKEFSKILDKIREKLKDKS